MNAIASYRQVVATRPIPLREKVSPDGLSQSFKEHSQHFSGKKPKPSVLNKPPSLGFLT
jgi:hypothetical protein